MLRLFLAAVFTVNAAVRAQGALSESEWNSIYRREIVQTHLVAIRSLSRSYDVDERAILYILDYELRDSSLNWNPFDGFNLWNVYKDTMQDGYASRGMIPDKRYLVNPMISPEIARLYPDEFRDADMEIFERFYAEDLANESCSKKSPVRNWDTHWMFSSLGPAQFQIYFALFLVRQGEITNDALIQKFKDESGSFSLQYVAHALASHDWISFELLAAEIRMARRIYWNERGVDIGHDYEKLLQLHLCGNFRYFAIHAKP